MATTDDDGVEYVDYVMIKRDQIDLLERGLGKINDYIDLVADGTLPATDESMRDTAMLLAQLRGMILEQAELAPLRVPIIPLGPPPSGPDLKLVG